MYEKSYNIKCLEIIGIAFYNLVTICGGKSMFAVKAVYDGNSFKFKEPLSIKEKYEVIITFTDPIKTTQEGILQFFDTWDKDDVDCIAEMIKERDNFSLNRDEI